jgi:transcription elongation GreA/GreB family factor
MDKDYKLVKTCLLDVCIKNQQLMMKTARQAMRDMQESALEGRSNEDLTDAFAAQCQNEHSMYASRLHEANGILTILERAKNVKKSSRVGFGSLVITDQQNFFVAASIGAFKLDEHDFFIISAQTPVFKAMEGREAGERFEFRGRSYKILEVI